MSSLNEKYITVHVIMNIYADFYFMQQNFHYSMTTFFYFNSKVKHNIEDREKNPFTSITFIKTQILLFCFSNRAYRRICHPCVSEQL